jgi:hypothetical protein
MVPDEESVIRKDDPNRKRRKPRPSRELENELEAQGFRPHGYEW